MVIAIKDFEIVDMAWGSVDDRINLESEDEIGVESNFQYEWSPF